MSIEVTKIRQPSLELLDLYLKVLIVPGNGYSLLMGKGILLTIGVKNAAIQ